MKGVKIAEFANASSRKFQSDHILANKIQMPDGIEVFESLKKLVVENQKITVEFKKITEDNKKITEENKVLTQKIATLEKALKALTEKVDSFETEE